MQRHKLFLFLRIVVSLSLLGLLLWFTRENLSKIGQLLRSVNISLFIFAFVMFLFSIVFMAWRLKIILAGDRVLFSIKETFGLTLIGYFFTNFMPTTVGGDIVKGYFLSRKNKKRLSAYTSVFMDRTIGMFSVVLIANIALLMMRGEIEHGFIIWVILSLLVFCVIFALSLFQQKLLQRIAHGTGASRILQAIKLESPVKRAYQTLKGHANNKGLILKTLALSLSAQLICFYAVYLLSQSLSAYIPFAKITLLMPIIIVLCILPVSMNGLGLREWSFVFFFSPYVGEPAALSLALLYLAMFLFTSLMGGIIYLFWR